MNNAGVERGKEVEAAGQVLVGRRVGDEELDICYYSVFYYLLFHYSWPVRTLGRDT